MKGTLKKIELKELKTKDGKKFNKVEFTVDVVVEESKGIIQTLKGNYSEDFAKKYFKFAGVKTSELINKEVGVVLAKKVYENDKGEKRTLTFIRFLNVLDADGNAIIMPKEGAKELDF